MEALLAAAISSGITLLGTIYSVNASQRKTQASVESTVRTEMAVMNTKIENLTKSVDKHNGFAERIPVLEQFKDDAIKRFERLEDFHME